jgi:hypothetical protein
VAAIESDVSAAEQYHLVVVLNDNTEFAPRATWSAQHGPTHATEIFWQDLAGLYGHDPQVIFDLLNEPRTYAPGMSQAQEWQLWPTAARSAARSTLSAWPSWPAQFVLAGRAGDRSAVPAVPGRARDRPQRLSTPAGLPGQTFRPSLGSG